MIQGLITLGLIGIGLYVLLNLVGIVIVLIGGIIALFNND